MEEHSWKPVIRDWARFKFDPESATVESRSINDALVASLVDEFQHYSLFDKYYTVIVNTILEGICDEPFAVDGPRGRTMANKSWRFFRELREIIFPEARPFRKVRMSVRGAGGGGRNTNSRAAVNRSSAAAQTDNEPIGNDSPMPMSQLSDGTFGESPLPSPQRDQEDAFWSEPDQESEPAPEWVPIPEPAQDSPCPMSPPPPPQEEESAPSVCIICRRNNEDDTYTAMQDMTIIDGVCDCSVSMCRRCWKEFYQTAFTRPDIAFIACPICKENLLPRLELAFPEVHYVEEIPADVHQYWAAQTRGETIAPPAAGGDVAPRRVCKLCNRITNPPHTRRSCAFRPLRREFVQREIEKVRHEITAVDSALNLSLERLRQAEDWLMEVKEEVEWNEADLMKYRKIYRDYERELDEPLA
jgi:hypothetical protein